MARYESSRTGSIPVNEELSRLVRRHFRCYRGQWQEFWIDLKESPRLQILIPPSAIPGEPTNMRIRNGINHWRKRDPDYRRKWSKYSMSVEKAKTDDPGYKGYWLVTLNKGG